MTVREIAFLGDSFTWGEGLELYLDSPLWKEQRNQRSMWMDMIHLQTEESKKFREANRFSNLVSNHFNSKIIIDQNNGGWIGSITDHLVKIINNNFNPEFIIIQFSCFLRDPIHYHLGSLYRKCECGRCEQHQPTIHCFYHLKQVIEKKYIYNQELDKIDQFYFDWLNDEFYSKTTNNKDISKDIINNIDSVLFNIDSYSYLHLNYLLDNYIKPLESRGIKIFYLDSWEPISSEIIHQIPAIKENLIPLKMWGSNDTTLKYSEFENSFLYPRIQYEFPKTDNGHPTLVQHQHIAESIINQIEK